MSVGGEQKKILLLGGSSQQISAIEKAKALGYYTVLCDFLPDNPGQYVADKFYPVSTTDKEAVLSIAKNEVVDGVLAYASDPAAPTAAYVAEKMGLPGNPYKSVEILCNKDMFREFLVNNGFCAPKARGYGQKEDVIHSIGNFKLPVIVKPVDSSGSKGVTVLYSWDALASAVDFAFSYSFSHRIIIEEYIEKKHMYLVGGDILISNGKVVLWGLLNCHRDGNVNPLVPVGKSYPLMLESADEEAVRYTLQRVVDVLKIKTGAMNVELVIDKNDRVGLIDIGPRAGGNMIPELLGMIFDADIVKMIVLAAMGMEIQFERYNGSGGYATHNLHSNRNGIYRGVHISSTLEKHIVRKCIYKQPGDSVEFFDNASKALGIIFLKFNDSTEREKILTDINQYIAVEIE